MTSSFIRYEYLWKKLYLWRNRHKEQFDKTDYVFTYSSKQAIEDGVLVDIPDTAKNYGFIIQVAITTNLLNSYVKPSNESAIQYTPAETNIQNMLEQNLPAVNTAANDNIIKTDAEINYISKNMMYFHRH